MSTPTDAEVEALERQLREAHGAERPPDAPKARGLELLLEREAALPPPRWPGLPWGKIGAGSAIVLLVSSAWWFWPKEQPTVVPPAPAPVIEPVKVVAPPAPVEPPAPLVEPTVAPEPTPAPVPTPPAPTPTPVRHVEQPDDLARELALIDQARTELESNPTLCLATLTKYDTEFGNGRLRLEAMMVRVQALLALGKRPEAERVAKKLAAADSQGLFRNRLARLMADAGQ